jgi:hypothetical protein
MTNIQTNQLKQGTTYMSNLTREEQHAKDLARVKQNGYALEFVNTQTEEICLAAVKQNGHTLRHVNEQTEEICLAAVKQNGYALQHVEEQTEEICLAAVKQNGDALYYVKVQTEEICLAAVNQNGYALDYVKVQTEAICLAAVKANGSALYYVEEQTESICLAAVNQYGNALELVKVQTEEICLAAVAQDPDASIFVIANIPFVKDLNIKVLDAVTSTGSLDMEEWHTCSTTHCWAGWIVHLAGKEGYALEEETSTEFAAKAIFKKSTGKSIDTKNFHTDNETAMEKIKEFAKGS